MVVECVYTTVLLIILLLKMVLCMVFVHVVVFVRKHVQTVLTDMNLKKTNN